MVVLPAGVDMLQALNDIATRGGRWHWESLGNGASVQVVGAMGGEAMRGPLCGGRHEFLGQFFLLLMRDAREHAEQMALVSWSDDR
jgi:hypothetical protein